METQSGLAARTGRCGSRGGFTLMELLVATILASIVLGGMYTALNTAILTLRTGEAGIRHSQGARISMALMQQELQCVIPGAELLFEGDEDELQFFAVTKPLDVEEGTRARIMRVRYRIKNAPGTRENVLVREEAVVKGPFPRQEEQDRGNIQTNPVKLGVEETFELASGIQGLRFSYYWMPASRGIADQSLATEVGEPIVMKENKRGWGLPQGLKIVLEVSDPNSESGIATFTTFVAFQGATTLLQRGQPGELGSL
ncbi:MAG: prepilin-type N-terminal cleavage/methylation domain-containing protein [FCB group bacterium]|nr:prepilin-type N-terminal cleavage/methylation domain-containing protein [FCB group bacterium]